MSIEARLRELGIELPEAPSPIGNYVGSVRHGDLCFLSGMGPRRMDDTTITGKVGGDLSIEDGYEAARLVGLNALAVLQRDLGNLDRVRRVVKILGMVNAVPEFNEHPKVINGYSDLMVEVFGDVGRGARSAVGMGSLPFQIAVEVEMIVAVAG